MYPCRCNGLSQKRLTGRVCVAHRGIRREAPLVRETVGVDDALPVPYSPTEDVDDVVVEVAC